MKLNKFTWNNGTQSSPIVLTNDQIKKLIAIGQRTDIVSDIRGYVTTNSRKMQKFLKYALTQQFPNLNVVCDEELADTFTLQTSSTIIKEGSRELITISTDTGITHNFLKWKYEYSDFIIDGDISQDNIKSRIRVENGVLVVDDPQENASWSVTLKLTAYPIYYNDSDFDTIPATSKPDIVLTITAKKITDISVSTKAEVLINSKVDITVTPVPADSTKLKGAIYTYTTSTPDILNINTSSAGTKVIAIKQGTGSITVTVNACNNTVIKSNSTSLSVLDLRPISFIIDQRGTIVDATDMVSENFIRNSDGSITGVSINGATGTASNNVITWIRQNTHAYVSKYMGISGVRLKQLDDTTRKKFADGTSAVDYISNESGIYDVLLKFDTDIYYKTEPYTPSNEASPNADYVLVTIAISIPDGEDITRWQKWSQYKLIGVYPSCEINNKYYSLSGKHPAKGMKYNDATRKAEIRHKFSLVTYQMTKLFAFLFYGYYGSLDCQNICGYGTKTDTSDGTFYPKLTGLTDDLGMTDTSSITGNGSDNPDDDQIIAGFGSDIKSVNFWGLENYWGDGTEYVKVLPIYNAGNPRDTNVNYANKLIVSYIAVNGKAIVTGNDGITRTFTDPQTFFSTIVHDTEGFFKIYDDNIGYRFVSYNRANVAAGLIKKINAGDYGDIVNRQTIENSTYDTSFSDYTFLERQIGTSCNIFRSGYSNNKEGGVAFLSARYNNTNMISKTYVRLIYNGDENTVHIIDDVTETF